MKNKYLSYKTLYLHRTQKMNTVPDLLKVVSIAELNNDIIELTHPVFYQAFNLKLQLEKESYIEKFSHDNYEKLLIISNFVVCLFELQNGKLEVLENISALSVFKIESIQKIIETVTRLYSLIKTLLLEKPFLKEAVYSMYSGMFYHILNNIDSYTFNFELDTITLLKHLSEQHNNMDNDDESLDFNFTDS